MFGQNTADFYDKHFILDMPCIGQPLFVRTRVKTILFNITSNGYRKIFKTLLPLMYEIILTVLLHIRV